MLILVNGQFDNQLPVQDRGLAYGDGVFETLAVEGDQLAFWPQHWQRLINGLQTLDFACSATQLKQDIEGDIRRLLATNDLPRAVLKITVTRGLGGRGYLPPETCQPNRIVQLLPWPDGREQLADTGVQVRLCKHAWGHNRALAGLKHLNRLDQVLARQEWQGDQWQEGIMLNQQGQVQSGVMSNVFVEQGGILYTPANDGAGIDGIMAAQVQHVAQQLAIEVRTQAIPLSLLDSAEGMFLTNSLNAIWPVVQFDQTSYPVTSMTRQLQVALAAHSVSHSHGLAVASC